MDVYVVYVREAFDVDVIKVFFEREAARLEFYEQWAKALDMPIPLSIDDIEVIGAIQTTLDEGVMCETWVDWGEYEVIGFDPDVLANMLMAKGGA